MTKTEALMEALKNRRIRIEIYHVGDMPHLHENSVEDILRIAKKHGLDRFNTGEPLEVRVMDNAELPSNDCVSCQWFHQGKGVAHNHCDNRHPFNDRGHSRANGRDSIDGEFSNCPYKKATPPNWIVGISRADK